MAPSPEFLFDIGGGPLFDIGPYYLTALVHIFGPVRRVSATSSRPHATRVSASGYRCCDSMLWLELWLVSVDDDDLTQSHRRSRSRWSSVRSLRPVALGN